MSTAAVSRGIDVSPGVAVVALAGEVESSELHAIRVGLAEVEGSRRVVIDLSRVTFVDSGGIGCLIGVIRRVEARGGDVVLCGARTGIARLLRLTGVDRLAKVAPSLDAARHLQASAG